MAAARRGGKTILATAWEGLVVLAALLVAVDSPLRLASEGHHELVSHGVDVAITLLFSLDFLFHLRGAGYLGGDGRGDRSRLLLVCDFLAALPFRSLPVLPIFELLRLLKLPRVTGQLGVRQRRAFHNPIVVRMLTFLFWLAFGTHWMACGWLALRHASPEIGAGTDYLRALYWTVTTLATVGYGDVTPTTPGQMVYAMVTMILGVGVYGYVIGSVAGLLANLDPARVRHEELVERVSAFMRYRRVPPHLRERVLAYYEYLWEMRLGYDESSAIAELPPTLRTEISLFLNREIIEAVPLLQEAGQEFVRAIALEMRPMIFMPGDYVVRVGEMGDAMYFISRGAVEVLVGPDEEVVNTLEEGDFFGELSLISGEPRSASVRAVGYCDVYSLSRKAFERALKAHPRAADRITRIAKARLEADDARSTVPPGAPEAGEPTEA